MEPNNKPSNTPSQINSPIHRVGKVDDSKVLIVGILILIVIVIIGIVWIVTSSNNKTSSSSQAISKVQPAEVTITSKGLSPSTISIVRGQAIVWTNKDSAKHQIATDPYPADNGVSGFKGSIQMTNDSYSFIFNKTGKFTYHDDLNPYTIKGEIIVK